MNFGGATLSFSFIYGGSPLPELGFWRWVFLVVKISYIRINLPPIFKKRYDATCVQTFKRNWKMFAKFPFVSRDVNNKFWKCLSSLSFKIAKLEFSFFFPFHKAINNLPCKLCKLRSLRLWWLCQIKMASTEGGDQPPESKQDSVCIGSTCFSIDLNYVKSLLGIFEAAIIVSIICLTPSIYLI